MAGFSGFRSGTVDFFVKLAKHNDKKWFDAHREEYEHEVLELARAFSAIHDSPTTSGHTRRIWAFCSGKAGTSAWKAPVSIFTWNRTS
jgi:hypothetical protein